MKADLPPPPILTPRVIEELDGQMSATQRQRLSRLLDEAVRECFVPVTRLTVDELGTESLQSIRRFAPYRMKLASELSKAYQEPSRAIHEVIGAIATLEEEWSKDARKVGLSKRDMRGLLRGLRGHLSEVGSMVRRPDFLAEMHRLVLGNEAAEYLERLFFTATIGDFDILAIFLGVEGTIALPQGASRWFLAEGTKALRGNRELLSILLASDHERSVACLGELLRGRLGISGKPRATPSLPPPIRLPGVPLSEFMIRERS